MQAGPGRPGSVLLTMATTTTFTVQWLKRTFVLVVALPALLHSFDVMSAETALPSGAPPTSYRLDAIKLRLQRAPGHGQPKQALVVAGAGGAELEFGRPSTTNTFTLSADEVMTLLNGLYHLRFFELPDVLRARSSVFLLADGRVGTQRANRLDTTACTVCVTLPGYEKCVRFAEGDGTPELEAWTQAAFADALRRVHPTTPGK